MSTKEPSTLAKIFGIVCGAAAITLVAIGASAAGRDDFAKGAVIGGAAMLIVMAVLFARGARGGAAARVANGVADERESRILRDAASNAAVAMFATAMGGAVWAMFDAPAIGLLAIVMWAGLITFTVSFALRVRKG